MELRKLRHSRRAIIKNAALAAFASPAIGQGGTTPLPGNKSATFVLVHGAWHGGWCWQRVIDRLTAKGYRVFAPTLTGVCERSHLDSPSVDLSTHVRDVVNEIRWKDLENVVLVGHSYAGMVISGVAEQVASKIAAIVYLSCPRLSFGENRTAPMTPVQASLSSVSRKLNSHPRRGNAGSACRGSRRGGRCFASRRSQ